MIRAVAGTRRRRGGAAGGPVVLVTSSAHLHHPRMYHLLARGLAEAGLPVVAVGQPDLAPHPPGPVPVLALPVRSGRLARMLSGPAVIRAVARLRPSLVIVAS